MKISNTLLLIVLAILPVWGFTQEIEVRGRVAGPDSIPLPGVNVRIKDSGRGTTTDFKGRYTIQVPKGSVLVFSGIGMKMVERKINGPIILDIVMNSAHEMLDEVTVTFKKPVIEADKGKMTFNVSDNATNSGVSAFDLLKKIPGVSIDQNDDILWKGTPGINVMIDGKMSYISGNQLGIFLKGLSAEEISKVELIANPSASFDAAGNSGIINIVTKKNKIKGYALSLRSNLSKGASWMNNQNISGSINETKWNAYASFDYNTPHRRRDGTSNNSITENGEKIDLERSNAIPFLIYYYTWKAGGNWQFAPGHKLGIHYHGYLDDFSGAKTSDISKRNSDGTLLSKVYSTYELIEPYHYDAFNFDYEFIMDSAGKKITADARYISYRNFSDALMVGDHYAANGSKLFSNTMRTHQPGFIKIKSLQADADLPFKVIRVNAGLKFAEVGNDNNFHSEELINGEYVEIPSMTDHFKYNERIGAVYASASGTFANTEFDVGLRLEHTRARADLANAQLNRKMEYTRLFPNVSASRRFDNNNKLNFSMSRRINRPAYSDLNPVRWYNDEYFYYYGNPELVPEMAWIFSSSYIISGKYIFTAEYSKRNNYISNSLSYDPNGVTIRSQSANFAHFDRLDLNAVSPINLVNGWDLQLLAGINYTTYPISESGQKNSLKNWGAILSINQQIKFLKKYSADISAKYTSRELYGVYLTDDIFFVDLGVKRAFFGGKLDAVISVTDLFNTYREIGYSQSILTNYRYDTKPDSRRFALTLQYHFGGNLTSGNRRKTEEQERL